MRHELQRSKVAPLITAELLLTDITYVLDDLSQMLRWHVRFLCFYKTTFALLAETISLRP